MLKRISDTEIGIAKFPILKSALGVNWQEYVKETDLKILETQLAADKKVVTEMIEEIEKTASPYGELGSYDMIIKGQWWQTFKKKYLKGGGAKGG